MLGVKLGARDGILLLGAKLGIDEVGSSEGCGIGLEVTGCSA